MNSVSARESKPRAVKRAVENNYTPPVKQRRARGKQALLQDQEPVAVAAIVVRGDEKVLQCLCNRVNGEPTAPCDVHPYVRVHTLIGSTHFILFDAYDTVLEFKQRIQNKAEIPVDQQRLIYKGQQLEDEQRLCDYAIGKDDVLHLVLRLRGGMFHWTSGRTDSATHIDFRVDFDGFKSIITQVLPSMMSIDDVVKAATLQLKRFYEKDDIFLLSIAEMDLDHPVITSGEKKAFASDMLSIKLAALPGAAKDYNHLWVQFNSAKKQ